MTTSDDLRLPKSLTLLPIPNQRIGSPMAQQPMQLRRRNGSECGTDSSCMLTPHVGTT
jgi:hypothetical protein